MVIMKLMKLKKAANSLREKGVGKLKGRKSSSMAGKAKRR